MTQPGPDVTVVVIGYNDATRLPRAIASVQRQTLRNLEIVVVDDASTDDTADVVRAMAVEDPRIRYTCLPANSGGCSAPRNAGVELARAPWVMFCDSDDEYERHACKNLLLAAERLDADVVCGAAERVDIRTGTARRWKPELHDHESVADGLVEMPELLADTISVNKIYRRSLLVDNGIRFPDGLLFEDQLFTLEAMAHARRVASIPQTVYRWYVDELSDEPSITQRRHEADNVDSRIEINRRIDAFLAAPGREALREIKDRKFLRHDLYLYLAVMLDVDDATALTLMERLRPYVASVNLAPAWQLRTGLRVAIYHLLVGDLDGIRAAMRMVKWAAVVDAPITSLDGRQHWACEHLDSDDAPGGFPSREWLDVTELHLPLVPFSQRRFLHRLDDLNVTSGRVVATGSSVDYDGSLADAETVELQFVIGRSRLVASVPAAWTGRAGDRRTWRADGALVDRLDRPLADTDHGAVCLAVSAGAGVNVTSVRSDHESQQDALLELPVRDPRVPDVLDVHAVANGGVGWTAEQSPTHQDAVRRHERRMGLPGTGALARAWDRARRHFLTPAMVRLGAALPARRMVVFDTSSTRTRNDSVRALSERLRVMRPDIRQAWVHRGRPASVPAYAAPLERLTWAHRWAAARARWLVDDGTASMGVRVRSAGRVVYVSDGVPLQRVGLDDPSVLSGSAARADVTRRARRWSTAVVPSAFAADVVRRGHDFSGDVIETGMLRADALLAKARTGTREERRAALDLDVGRSIVVYAPALRAPRTGPTEALINLDEWAAALGTQAYLVIAGDPREPIEDARTLRHGVRVLTAAEQAGDFLAACDLLVTDYSSLVGDAAVAGIPTVLFQPDRQTFIDRIHGIYVEPSSIAPTAETTGELIALVREFLADTAGWSAKHAAAMGAYAAEYCGAADGASADRAVEALWPAATGRGGADR